MDKMQKIIILLILTASCMFCARQKSEPKAQQSSAPITQPQKRDSITVSVLYPADDRNGVTRQFRTMSEADIKTDFNELLGRMFPEENRASVRGIDYKSFSRYVAQRTAADPRIQEILSGFEKSGVYFFVKDKSKAAAKSRYGDNNHIALTRGWAYAKMKAFIEDNTDLEGSDPITELDKLLGGGGEVLPCMCRRKIIQT